MRTAIILSRSPYWVVSLEPAHDTFRLTRSTREFEPLSEIGWSSAQVNAALDRDGPRAGRSLLIDLRDSPLRNDPEFEQAFARHRVAIVAGFARLAVLVRTEIGRLQVERHAREDGAEMPVFTSEETALAYLQRRDDAASG